MITSLSNPYYSLLLFLFFFNSLSLLGILLDIQHKVCCLHRDLQGSQLKRVVREAWETLVELLLS